MPYIHKDLRRQANAVPSNAGELNYKLTLTILDYVERRGLNYQSINDVIGALESCKAEFQRRVVASYEEEKIRINGDVYPEGL